MGTGTGPPTLKADATPWRHESLPIESVTRRVGPFDDTNSASAARSRQ